MEQLVEFVQNHWGLSLAVVVVVGALGWTFVQPRLQGVRKLSPMDATRLINHEDAVIVDVRGEGEFGQGHILNALHIPVTSLSDQIGKLEKYKSRPIITACRTGQQSASACVTLRRRGFEKVFNLGGGMLAWENENLPVTKR